MALACAAPSAANWMSCRTAGCHGSLSVASGPSCRSAAIAYWVRSLVPSEAKMTSRNMADAVRAADGTSTMTPGVLSPAEAHSEAKRRASSAVEIMGAMTCTSELWASAAAAMALS